MSAIMQPGGSNLIADRPIIFLHQDKKNGCGFVQKVSTLSLEIMLNNAVVQSEVFDPTLAEDPDCSCIYKPDITIGATLDPGDYTVVWTYRLEGETADRKAKTGLKLVPLQHPVLRGYAQVQCMIDAGVPLQTEPDGPGCTVEEMAKALNEASAFIEEYTRRWFYPRCMCWSLDGEGGPMLLLGNAIIAVCSLEWECNGWGISSGCGGCCQVRIYNRHVRQGLVEPDDREAPKIEFCHRRLPKRCHLHQGSLRFPDKQQNVDIEGVFGYTDYDGSIFGVTPPLIKEAALRLAMKRLEDLWIRAGEGSSEPGAAGPVVSLKTFDQSISYANLIFDKSGAGSAFIGSVTGDPEIDRILNMYRIPFRVTVA